MSLLFTVGILMSLPWIVRVCKLLGRAAVIYFIPSKTTTITLTLENEGDKSGSRVIELKNTDAIADVILKATGHIKRD
ncbi:hypothetical protein M3895_004534 [Vibrio parahaemolyticus]|uniref:hypothetical protein n=1 Tax=Vibrio harveyi group TaxID=717610 RepID=UPI0015F50F68|nr:MULTISPECIES: hypothetical protein [Vibrio harveyi group]EJE4169109.1 hypothetical protein [Vibrio parahaemolyticus]MCI9706490.1 hypothetical protein [Vibrio parahaemolyticus]MDF4637794.1 hypothetical protein [Vibrio parahaemolyticus]MDF5483821.1 hypothetical protein [Vibrio parahaemolyticus]MDG2622670.1 hypothetical protein [Vibrio parahaemolyticus]